MFKLVSYIANGQLLSSFSAANNIPASAVRRAMGPGAEPCLRQTSSKLTRVRGRSTTGVSEGKEVLNPDAQLQRRAVENERVSIDSVGLGG